MIKEVHDIASQHEVMAESLNALGTKQVVTLMQELKQERKKCLREAKDLQNQLAASIQQSEAVRCLRFRFHFHFQSPSYFTGLTIYYIW